MPQTLQKKNKEKLSKINIVNTFFEFLLNIKFAHLTTLSFSKHHATDKLYDEFNNLYDKFLEVYIAKYGRFEPKQMQEIRYKSMTDNEFKKYLNDFNNFLSTEIFHFINKEEDTDIISIVDDIKVSVVKTLYQLDLQ
jgi:hypothetical protein